VVTIRDIISLRNKNKAFDKIFTPQALYGVRPGSEEGGVQSVNKSDDAWKVQYYKQSVFSTEMGKISGI